MSICQNLDAPEPSKPREYLLFRCGIDAVAIGKRTKVKP
jgi:hypothetical protein